MEFGRPTRRTGRAVFPHTALQSVGSYGLNEMDMGCSQAPEPMLRKVGVRPTPGPRLVFAVPPVSLQKKASQAAANHAVVAPEDIPVAMTEVIEPALR